MTGRIGATDRDCPLCGDMGGDENAIPTHIRRNCPVAARIRVYELELGPTGFGAEPGNRTETSGANDYVERDPETGHFVPRGETA